MPPIRRRPPLLALCAVLCLCGVSATQAQEPQDDSGWMGLYIRDLDQRDIEALNLSRTQRGVVVSGVDDEGPAATAGIEPGDVITALDGRAVDSRADFVRLLGPRRAGDRIRLQVLHRGSTRQVAFALQPRPRVMRGSDPIDPGEPPPSRSVDPMPGWLAVSALDDENLAQYFDVGPENGVLVLRVVGEAVDRFQAGDVIIECGDAPVRSVPELRRLWRPPAGPEPLVVRVVRRGRVRTLHLREDAATARLVALPSETIGGAEERSTQAWDELLREIAELRARLQALESEVQERAQR